MTVYITLSKSGIYCIHVGFIWEGGHTETKLFTFEVKDK